MRLKYAALFAAGMIAGAALLVGAVFAAGEMYGYDLRRDPYRDPDR